MKKAYVALTVALCLCLSGCAGWMDGTYSAVRPHTERQNQPEEQTVAAANFDELMTAMENLLESGGEHLRINVSQMDADAVTGEMDRAVAEILKRSPVCAYAVDSITYDRGTSGGQQTLAVTVVYNHNRSQLRRMKQLEKMEDGAELIKTAMNDFESALVMRITDYRGMDFEGLIRSYAQQRPDKVMEIPMLTVNTYPETGTDRVVELLFTYQNSRESLRTMQARVRPLFTSAQLYVQGNESAHDQYTQLYAFLMERHEYELNTSMTPAYSLLVHGVGDSRAFAEIFAAMCTWSELECMIVSGTCNGESLFWNIICDDGIYYHLDLIRCNSQGCFQLLTDEEMSGYVWDYSAYPKCGEPQEEHRELE